MQNFSNPNVWKFHYWFVLDCVAWKYPKNPTSDVKKYTETFYDNISHMWPTNDYRKYYCAAVNKFPITSVLAHRECLINWVNKIKKYVECLDLNNNNSCDDYQKYIMNCSCKKSIAVMNREMANVKDGYNDPKIWGKHFWYVIDNIADRYPSDPSNKFLYNVRIFFDNLKNILPCEICKTHYKQILLKYPIESSLCCKSCLLKWIANTKNSIKQGDKIKSEQPTSTSHSIAPYNKFQNKCVDRKLATNIYLVCNSTKKCHCGNCRKIVQRDDINECPVIKCNCYRCYHSVNYNCWAYDDYKCMPQCNLSYSDGNCNCNNNCTCSRDCGCRK